MKHDDNFHKYISKDLASIKRGQQSLFKKFTKQDKTIYGHGIQLKVHWGLIIAGIGVITTVLVLMAG